MTGFELQISVEQCKFNATLFLQAFWLVDIFPSPIKMLEKIAWLKIYAVKTVGPVVGSLAHVMEHFSGRR